MVFGFRQPYDMDKIIRTTVFLCSKEHNFNVFCSAHDSPRRFKCSVSDWVHRILFFGWLAVFRLSGAVSNTRAIMRRNIRH